MMKEPFAKLYSTTALRAFEATARCGSFAAAARELHITRPAVSRHVKNLEERLGTQLIDRETRPRALTEPGVELFQSLRDAFEIINIGLNRVQRANHAAPQLRLLVEHDFANGWLSGNIGHFLVNHPEVSVEIKTVGNLDFRPDQEYDFRVFFRPIDSSTPVPLTKIDLCGWLDVPLCSPDYAALFAKHDRRGVRQWHLLHDRNDSLWRNWIKAVGLEEVSPEREMTFSETSLCLAASAAGAGVTIGDTFLARDYIASGQLVCPLPIAAKSSETYSLFFTSQTGNSLSGQKFISWLTAALSKIDHDETCRLLSIDHVKQFTGA